MTKATLAMFILNRKFNKDNVSLFVEVKKRVTINNDEDKFVYGNVTHT